MKKSCIFLSLLSCVVLGCDSNHGVSSNGVSNVTEDIQFVNDSQVTLYYDTPQTVKLKLNESNAELKIQGNNCVDISTDSLKTDANNTVTLEIKAKLYNCENAKTVKVCVEEDGEMSQDEDKCAEFTIRTTTNDDEIDANHNLMIDAYETNKDKDKFANYQPGDCSSFCHDDGDCEDFCDSAIGYQCSTRCTRDDQCIKFLDDDDNWVQMVCREDGRCSYPSFIAVYDIGQDNATVTMGGQPVGDNVTIDWGDGSDIETIPSNTNDNLSHTYANKGRYTIEINGDYRNWTAGCVRADGIDLYDILRFGPIGLGYSEATETGSFWNCYNFNKFSAKDIPDPIKLVDMTRMFGGEETNGQMKVGMHFNDPAISRWDTSNVEKMVQTFFQSAVLNKYGFNQDISRWNVSRVKTMEGMFEYAYMFDQPIGCWDVSNVENISHMFFETQYFNQNLESWDLSKVTQHEYVFRWENGHNGAISLKNYCVLRSRVNNETIGRDTGNDHGSACCGSSGYGIGETLCSPYYTYASACNEDKWKKLVHDCYENYFKYQEQYKDLTEDTITCRHLRTCRDAYYMCQLCRDGDPKCASHNWDDYKDYNGTGKGLRYTCPGGFEGQRPDSGEVCKPNEVFWAYDDNTYSCDKNVHACHPCQHLDWD